MRNSTYAYLDDITVDCPYCEVQVDIYNAVCEGESWAGTCPKCKREVSGE